EVAGAGLPAAVVLAPLRSTRDRHVHDLAAVHVLQDGTISALDARDRRHAFLYALLPGTDEALRRHLRAQAEREGEAREPAEAVREHAEALLVSRNLIEEERGGAVDPAGELGRHPDLILRAGAPDDAQLAQVIDPPQPITEITEGTGRTLGDSHAHLPPPPVPGEGSNWQMVIPLERPASLRPVLLQEPAIERAFHE